MTIMSNTGEANRVEKLNMRRAKVKLDGGREREKEREDGRSIISQS